MEDAEPAARGDWPGGIGCAQWLCRRDRWLADLPGLAFRPRCGSSSEACSLAGLGCAGCGPLAAAAASKGFAPPPPTAGPPSPHPAPARPAMCPCRTATAHSPPPSRDTSRRSAGRPCGGGRTPPAPQSAPPPAARLCQRQTADATAAPARPNDGHGSHPNLGHTPRSSPPSLLSPFRHWRHLPPATAESVRALRTGTACHHAVCNREPLVAAFTIRVRAGGKGWGSVSV